MKQRLQALLLALLLTASLTLAGCAGLFQPEVDLGSVSISDFQGDNPWVELDGNQPAFTDQEKGDTQSFEDYTPLDALGRCRGGVCQPQPRAHAHPGAGGDRPGEARRLAHRPL